MGLSKKFRYIFSGYTASVLAESIFFIIILKWVEIKNSSISGLSATFAISFLPAVLFSIPISSWVGKMKYKNVIVATEICKSLLYLILYFTADRMPPVYLYLALFLNSVTTLFTYPAYQSLVPLTVEKQKLPKASGLVVTGYYISRILGNSGTAFLIIASIKLDSIMLATLLIKVTAALLALGIGDVKQEERPVHQKIIESIQEGFRYLISREKVLMTLMMFFTSYWILNGAIDVFNIAYVEKVLKTTSEHLGIFNIPYWVGAIIAALLVSKTYNRFEKKYFYLLIFFSYSSFFLSLISKNLFLIVGSYVLVGASSAFYETYIVTYIQENAEQVYIPRIFGVFQLLRQSSQMPGVIFFMAGTMYLNLHTVMWICLIYMLIISFMAAFHIPYFNRNKDKLYSPINTKAYTAE